ncbi:MAG TPA: DUF1552 domain-containing protein [Polyangia bacterium]
MPPHLFLQRAEKVLTRRLFMKALGAGMTVPAALRFSRMATAAPTAGAKRFLVFYTPHGTAPEHFEPRLVGGDRTNFDLDKTNVSILGPLQPYKQYVNYYQGMQYLGEAATHDGIVNCLTGSTASDTTTPRISVEHAIAKALGVKPLILGACSHQPYGLDRNGMLFWDGTSAVDPQKNPAKAFDSLFTGGGSSSGTGSADAQLQNDLLAFTSAEIQSLKGTLNGLTREQNKLQAHLNALDSLKSSGGGGGGGTPQSSCSSKPTLPTVEMVRKASAGNMPDSSNGNDWFYQASNFPLILQAQLELAAQAMICNAAPVIGLMSMYATCDFDFSFAGAPGSHHNTLSHTTPQAASGAQYNSPISVDNLNPSTRMAFATAQKWFTTQLVKYVVSVLATTDDPTAPGTKVLDNTIILWTSEIGDGADHNRASEVLYPQTPANLPLITIGKGGGALKSGQVVPFSVDPDKGKIKTSDRPASDLYLTLAKAMGAGSVTFPGQTGVITEVMS